MSALPQEVVNFEDSSSVYDNNRIAEVLRQYWGFESLRPIQQEAIKARLIHQDSLVVMPTGGGKSLIYQLPPLLTGELDIVISPLIALMKDQVDALTEMGYPAAALHGNSSPEERSQVFAGLHARAYRLLFISPERLLVDGFLDYLRQFDIAGFAIDEAHCISQWGHDFRPEFRQLSTLRQFFPTASVHGYTATATPRVRQDIAEQLALKDPEIFVGVFDRPNLVYRVIPSTDLFNQITTVLSRHLEEAVIIYCISRKSCESLAEKLSAKGFKAKAYHAGLDNSVRARVQDEFAAEKIDIVVATVAFGMGIDRSNVRCVIHAGIPKSIENYQQESGRAGRDGLESECVLFYSYADVKKWERVMGLDVEGDLPEHLLSQHAGLQKMARLCNSGICRHRALSRHFGQELAGENCRACDVCLGEIATYPDSTTVTQKILSGVARLDQRFGIGYLMEVLRGVDSEAVRNRGHSTLSTYGILKAVPERTLRHLIYQLVEQELLIQTPGDRPVIHLGNQARAVLRGELPVQLMMPAEEGESKKAKSTRSRAKVPSIVRGERSGPGSATEISEPDPELYEQLRELRRALASERNIPAYMVFSDATLVEMAAQKPRDLDAMRAIYGVGEKKLASFGKIFMAAIAKFGQGG